MNNTMFIVHKNYQYEDINDEKVLFDYKDVIIEYARQEENGYRPIIYELVPTSLYELVKEDLITD